MSHIRKRLSGDDLRLLARMLDAGLGNGNMYIDVDHGDSDYDYVGDPVGPRDVTRIAARRYDRYTLELDVEASAWALDAIEESWKNRGVATAKPVVHVEPKVDPLPSLELFIKITKTIVEAWASNMNRFSFLELK